MDFLLPYYDWFKAGHIISVISWMAGMFYLPRLFAYHAEKAPVGSEMDLTFQVMERKLLKIIMTPAMIASWFFGLILISMGGIDFGAVWGWVKIIAVFVMTGTHGMLSKRQKSFAAGKNDKSGRYYRLVNEIPTVLMLIIVIAVVVRPF